MAAFWFIFGMAVGGALVLALELALAWVYCVADENPGAGQAGSPSHDDTYPWGGW